MIFFGHVHQLYGPGGNGLQGGGERSGVPFHFMAFTAYHDDQAIGKRSEGDSLILQPLHDASIIPPKARAYDDEIVECGSLFEQKFGKQ